MAGPSGIDGSQINREVIVSCHATNRLQHRSRPRLGPITVKKAENDRIEQDHRRIKRRVRHMLGFKWPLLLTSSCLASK